MRFLEIILSSYPHFLLGVSPYEDDPWDAENCNNTPIIWKDRNDDSLTGNQYSTLVDPFPIKFFYFFYKKFDILERVGHHLDHMITLAIIFGRTTSPLHNLLTTLYNI